MDQISYTDNDIKAFETLGTHGPLGRRATFVFQYLFLRKDFREFIIETRKKWKLPIEGLVLSELLSQSMTRNSNLLMMHNRTSTWTVPTIPKQTLSTI